VDNEEAARILRPVVSRLRQKLEAVPGWNDWIKNVRGSGYVLDLSSN
jgi:DNA-binding response OmpR family regulator